MAVRLCILRDSLAHELALDAGFEIESPANDYDVLTGDYHTLKHFKTLKSFNRKRIRAEMRGGRELIEIDPPFPIREPYEANWDDCTFLAQDMDVESIICTECLSAWFMSLRILYFDNRKTCPICEAENSIRFSNPYGKKGN